MSSRAHKLIEACHSFIISDRYCKMRGGRMEIDDIFWTKRELLEKSCCDLCVKLIK